MKFRMIWAGAGAGLAAMLLASAAAAATIVAHSGTPLTEMVHNIDGTPDGNQLLLDTNPGGYLIDFSSSSILHNNGNSGGFAEVTGPGSTPEDLGFTDLTIDPRSPIGGFSAIQFKLEIPGALTTAGLTIPNGYQTAFSFDTRVFFAGGGYQDLLGTVSGGPHSFLVSASAGEVISKLMVSNLVGTSTKGENDPVYVGSYNFHGIKQVSFDAGAVPEPSTWAMMICGFGTAGSLLRRRRAAVPA